MIDKKIRGVFSETGFSGSFKTMSKYKDTMSTFPLCGEAGQMEWVKLDDASENQLISCFQQRYKFLSSQESSVGNTSSYAYMCAAAFELKKRGFDYQKLMI